MEKTQWYVFIQLKCEDIEWPSSRVDRRSRLLSVLYILTAWIRFRYAMTTTHCSIFHANVCVCVSLSLYESCLPPPQELAKLKPLLTDVARVSCQILCVFSMYSGSILICYCLSLGMSNRLLVIVCSIPREDGCMVIILDHLLAKANIDSSAIYFFWFHQRSFDISWI